MWKLVCLIKKEKVRKGSKKVCVLSHKTILDMKAIKRDDFVGKSTI